MIRAGELDQSIILQAPTYASDSMGGGTTTFSAIATVWAKAWTASSSEGAGGGQTGLLRVQKFKIRFRMDIKASWRILWGTRYFNIVSIDPDERREAIFITCKESE